MAKKKKKHRSNKHNSWAYQEKKAEKKQSRHMQQAEQWYAHYSGKHILRDYRAHFHVDSYTAASELQQLGAISEEQAEQHRRSLDMSHMSKEERKTFRIREEMEQKLKQARAQAQGPLGNLFDVLFPEEEIAEPAPETEWQREKREQKAQEQAQRRAARLDKARPWVEQFTGRHLVRRYKDRFHVDDSTAIRDLEALGAISPEDAERRLQEEERRIAREKLEEQELKERIVYETYFPDSDSDFYFIAGYTSGGVPYGVTWEEMGLEPWQLPDDALFYSGEDEGDDEDWFDDEFDDEDELDIEDLFEIPFGALFDDDDEFDAWFDDMFDGGAFDDEEFYDAFDDNPFDGEELFEVEFEDDFEDGDIEDA